MSNAAEDKSAGPRVFEPGDRVVRRVDVHDRSSRLMHGEVVERSHETVFPTDNPYRQVYTVRWDHSPEFPSKGYFWWGLDYERSDDA